MSNSILSDRKMPFCPGCSHGPSVKFLATALLEGGFDPLDVILVSDIGCCGLVDPLFNTHTIHGLHGRAPALAMGVAMGLNDPGKKVIAVQGDGGATIGLQHVLEASRRNLDITLILLNNLIYGMTGGQVSGLSTQLFKSDKHIADEAPPFDISQLAHVAGAALTIRVNNPKEISPAVLEALKTPGFTVVEISSMCQQYGVKKVADLEKYTRPNIHLTRHPKLPKLDPTTKPSLFNLENTLAINHTSKLPGRMGVLLAGSAGGGIQSAAKLLAEAAMISGLSATMKGEYPITVGTGFSMAEVILSKDEINYTGLEKPDLIIVVSEDGFAKIQPRIAPDSVILMDKAIKADRYEHLVKLDFVGKGGKKGAALSAITHWFETSGVLAVEALQEVAAKSRHSDNLLSIIDQSRQVEA